MQFPDYPFTSKFADVSGFKMHYLDEGPAVADPIIMLHGNPSWSFYYRKLIIGLRDQYRCIVPDHIGMGLSEKPSEKEYDFHFNQRVRDISGLLNNLSIKQKITLVVHDWGGMIGMLFTHQNPDQVKRLIILNTAASHLPEDKTLPVSLRLGRIPVINAMLIQGMNAFCRGAVKSCVSRPMSPDVADAYLAPYNTWHNRLAVRKFVEDIPIKIFDRGYEDISGLDHTRLKSIPKLICWGMKDFVFDQTFLSQWQALYPESEIHRFEDAGHYVLEDAADEIIPLVQTFLHNNPV